MMSAEDIQEQLALQQEHNALLRQLLTRLVEQAETKSSKV